MPELLAQPFAESWVAPACPILSGFPAKTIVGITPERTIANIFLKFMIQF
jgi:hypothetical protein